VKSALFVVCLGLAGCSVYSPDAGHQVVVVEKPMFFGHGGVDPKPVSVGRSFGAFTSEGIDVNMQPQKYEVLMNDTMTKDGVPVTFHAVLVLQVTDSVKMVTQFGPDWYKNNVDNPFQTMVRQTVRGYGMNEVAISATAIDEIDSIIRKEIVAFLEEKHIPAQVVTMTVGRANPPDSIKNQRIETATQEQRIQTEQQTKLAEDQRKMAEESRAAADNAYRMALGLSPEQYIQLQNINMQRQVCEHGNCTFILSGTPTMYNVGK